jgi:hypothetical protein
MSIPEVEVRSFKQQSGDSLKDAWYRISNTNHRCTKKYPTMILLTIFYVGISSWNRYVLDTLTGVIFWVLLDGAVLAPIWEPQEEGMRSTAVSFHQL